MKSLFLVFSFLFFLTACGQFKPATPELGIVDPVFDTLLEKYKDDKFRFLGTRATRKINILFFSRTPPTIGTCHIENDERTIYIDPTFWFYTSYNDQLTLLYHEMGHCDLNYGHVNQETIMNAEHLDGYYFGLDPDYYLTEFFIYRH